ncbi:MAG: hypothetical protein NT062_02060 [Proteobacteria bacterium]|nr:hypothetical protein [Pseudomonadota bacterium]
MKNLSKLGLAVACAMTSMLAGCELYFDGHDNGSDHWNYCGSDGYYDCYGDACTWVTSSCPVGGGSGGSGYSCTSSTDCAAGCYCANGLCEEAGFCATDADCGAGFHCNTDRASCEANPPQPTCAADSECPSGAVCADGACTSTCSCTTDAQAQQGGYGYCDESRNTCVPGTDPAGTCAGTITCNIVAPTCAAGSVPLILDGCYTGECRVITTCGETPSCGALSHEADCLNRASDCSAVYTGTGCHKPDGSACHAGDQNCLCSNFTFNSCDDRTAPRTSIIIDMMSKRHIDVSTMQP